MTIKEKPSGSRTPATESGTYEQLHAIYGGLLKGADHEALDISLATIYGNTQGDPSISVVLVGAPSTGKTETLLGLDELKSTHWLSTLTEKTLISGYITEEDEGVQGNKSLLIKLTRKGVSTLLFKEFGSIMGMHNGPRTEVISQLREVADGQIKKHFGTDEEVHWEGTMGMVAASTSDIEKYWSTITKLGDRWVFVRLDGEGAERLDVAKEVQKRLFDDPEADEDLLDEVVHDHFKSIEQTKLFQIKCSEEHPDRIAELADFLAIARTPVEYDKTGTVVNRDPEGPARLSLALTKLAMSLAVIRGSNEVRDEEVRTIQRIVRDSIPRANFEVPNALNLGLVKTKDIANEVSFGATKVGEVLMHFKNLGLVSMDKTKLMKGAGDLPPGPLPLIISDLRVTEAEA
jgi:hypothetical protein